MATLSTIRPFFCSACIEEHTAEPFQVGSDQICKEELRRLFEESIKYEVNFPPRWRGIALDAWDTQYRRIFSTHFLKNFDAKAKEWSCLEAQRIYCQHKTLPTASSAPCETFLGRWEDLKKCRKCEVCSWYTCLHCRTSFPPPVGKEGRKSTRIRHTCDPVIEDELRDRAFRGLKRGKDYQYCPNQYCRKPIQLAEACNHMTCVCGTEFCYVCGEAADGRSKHWARGGCPSHGYMGSGVHAVAAGVEDETDFEGDEEEAHFRWQMEMMHRQ